MDGLARGRPHFPPRAHMMEMAPGQGDLPGPRQGPVSKRLGVVLCCPLTWRAKAGSASLLTDRLGSAGETLTLIGVVTGSSDMRIRSGRCA